MAASSGGGGASAGTTVQEANERARADQMMRMHFSPKIASVHWS
jgi:hypothetical protein